MSKDVSFRMNQENSNSGVFSSAAALKRISSFSNIPRHSFSKKLLEAEQMIASLTPGIQQCNTSSSSSFIMPLSTNVNFSNIPSSKTAAIKSIKIPLSSRGNQSNNLNTSITTANCRDLQEQIHTDRKNLHHSRTSNSKNKYTECIKDKYIDIPQENMNENNYFNDNIRQNADENLLRKSAHEKICNNNTNQQNLREEFWQNNGNENINQNQIKNLHGISVSNQIDNKSNRYNKNSRCSSGMKPVYITSSRGASTSSSSQQQPPLIQQNGTCSSSTSSSSSITQSARLPVSTNKVESQSITKNLRIILQQSIRKNSKLPCKSLDKRITTMPNDLNESFQRNHRHNNPPQKSLSHLENSPISLTTSLFEKQTKQISLATQQSIDEIFENKLFQKYSDMTSQNSNISKERIPSAERNRNENFTLKNEIIPKKNNENESGIFNEICEKNIDIKRSYKQLSDRISEMNQHLNDIFVSKSPNDSSPLIDQPRNQMGQTCDTKSELQKELEYYRQREMEYKQKINRLEQENKRVTYFAQKNQSEAQNVLEELNDYTAKDDQFKNQERIEQLQAQSESLEQQIRQSELFISSQNAKQLNQQQYQQQFVTNYKQLEQNYVSLLSKTKEELSESNHVHSLISFYGQNSKQKISPTNSVMKALKIAKQLSSHQYK